MNPFRALSTTERTQLGRLRERAQEDRSALYEVLDTGIICHLGVIIDGMPVVLPTGYGRADDTLYLHGSSGNRSLISAPESDICVTVTLLDALVCARSVFHNSMNYRSAVIYGRPRLITDDDERLLATRIITEHLIPGRWDHSRQPTTKEMAATALLALPLAEASVKVRSGWPRDDEEDYELDAWAGRLPVSTTVGAPLPDPRLRPGIATPGHITALAGRRIG